MAIEQTLSIIKPDAVAKNLIGKIISRFEDNGLHLVAGKLVHLSDEMASGFYAEHEGRPFFNDLKKFMTSLIAIPELFMNVSGLIKITFLELR